MKCGKVFYCATMFLVLLLGGWLAARPPILEIQPAETTFGFERAVIKCELKNKSLFPINVQRPVFSQTLWFRVIAPDGKEIAASISETRAQNVITLKPGGRYEFEVDLCRRVAKEGDFPELSKDVGEKAKADYKKFALLMLSMRVFNISSPGKYKVQAYYYSSKDSKSGYGKRIWSRKIKSNTIEVLFENKRGASIE